MLRLATLPVLVLLAACGPLPVGVAEQQCLQSAREARGPSGTAGLGVVSRDGSLRAASKLDVTISSDWLRGADPASVYETCVISKSGQAPSRPLSQRPDWKG